uniref:Predicted protein n=1 Tax=Hordeum vulgare subsp. vulgare TaxID=112509 RepID=F2DT08_HORVV|nr:predicted protein [Hordeum vulgare subsp. vulgare]
MFKNRDVDEVSDVDQNDIDKILQDTEDLDNDLFKDINSKSKFGLSKTLPAAILKKPNATASDSQKNISFNFENDNDKLFDGFDSLVKKPLETKPPLQKQSSTRDIFNDISDDLELFNEKKPPKASIPNKPNDSFSKSKSFKEELFGKGSFDEDANVSNDGDLGKSSDDFKFGGYMPSSATSRSFKQSDGEKSDFLFDEEPKTQIRPRTSPSSGLSQTQTTTKADNNLLMRTAPVSLQKNSNSGSKAFDFDFDFDSLVKTKSKDKVQSKKTSSQTTAGQKPDWLMNLNNTSPAKQPPNKPIDTSIKSSFDDDEANIEPLQIESTKTSFKVSENRLESKHKLLDGDEWLDSKKAPSPSKKTNIDGTHYDSNEIQSMLQKIKQLEYENQELNMQLSNQKAHYEAQIAIINESHDQRVKMMREDRETLIKHQNEAKQALQAHINTLERQNNEAFTTYKQKLDEREREFEADLDKQRRLHREVAERLKADFTEQVEKLKRQKQVEVDSIMQIGVHSKSIENVVGKIEEQARTLDVMQQRVERGHVSNLVDVENQLKAKEEQLKAQESRLFKQQKEYENEIRLLNDMVQKLENHLAEQTKTASEERWKGKQQEKKMEALQEALMNEQRIVM